MIAMDVGCHIVYGILVDHVYVASSTQYRK